jgi:hypothetical protein
MDGFDSLETKKLNCLYCSFIKIALLINLEQVPRTTIIISMR